MAPNDFTPQLAMHAQQQSRFFTLPQELRNTIYEMAFYCEVESITLVKRTRYIASTARRCIYLDHASFPSAALLCACQQIHAEGVSFFKIALDWYFEKEFKILIHGHVDHDKYSFFAPDDYLARIRTVSFVFKSGVRAARIRYERTKQGQWKDAIIQQSPAEDKQTHNELAQLCKDLSTDPHNCFPRGLLSQSKLQSMPT